MEQSNNTSNTTNSPQNQANGVANNQKLSHTKKLSNKKTSTKKLSSSQPNSKSSTSTIMTDKKNRIKKQKALEQVANTDGIVFEAQATSPESKKTFKVPLRATITNKDKDLDVTKTSVWVLMTLAQCTMKEVKEFEDTYKDELTYSEKLSLKLLKDALRGNKQAQTIYWGIMDKVANRPKVLNQVNFVNTGVEQGSIMSQMLDQITQNITQTKPQTGQDAQEGEIVL